LAGTLLACFKLIKVPAAGVEAALITTRVAVSVVMRFMEKPK
jgi:hypothetical protein